MKIPTKISLDVGESPAHQCDRSRPLRPLQASLAPVNKGNITVEPVNKESVNKDMYIRSLLTGTGPTVLHIN